MSLTVTPSEHVLYDGVLSELPVGRLESGEERQIEFGVCFVGEGGFDIHAEARLVDANLDDEVKVGEGELRVFVRSEP